MNDRAAELMREFEITAPGPDAPMRLAVRRQPAARRAGPRAVRTPKVLVAAQPTRGLDVGAIEYMSGRLQAAADAGVGVLLISTELEEILALAHRIVRDPPRPGRRRDVTGRGRPRAARPAHGRRRRHERPMSRTERPAAGSGRRRARRHRVCPRRRAARPRSSWSASTWSRSTVALALCALLVSADRRLGRAACSRRCSTAACARRARGGSRSTTAAPLLIVAVGTIIATKAGLVEHRPGGPAPASARRCARTPRCGCRGPAGWCSACAAGRCRRGCLWAGLAAGMRYSRQVPEVISTLLLVFIAFQLVAYGLTQTWLLLDRNARINHNNTGEPLPADTRLGQVEIFGNTISLSVVLAVVLALLVAAWLARSVGGFRLRMLGLNPRAAQRAGVSAAMVGGSALVVCGAFAGLAGGALLAGERRATASPPASPSNLGWQGLLVALLARERPAGGHPDGVRVRRAAHRLRLPRGHRASTAASPTSCRRCSCSPCWSRPPSTSMRCAGRPSLRRGRRAARCSRERRRDLRRRVLVDRRRCAFRLTVLFVLAAIGRVDRRAGRHDEHLGRGHDPRRRLRGRRRGIDHRQRLAGARLRGGVRADPGRGAGQHEPPPRRQPVRRRADPQRAGRRASPRSSTPRSSRWPSGPAWSRSRCCPTSR